MLPSKNVARIRGLLRGTGGDPRKLAINVTHSMYYRSVIRNTRYHGVQILKSPLDLWIYQELLSRDPVDLVVETGTFNGGSALYLAHLMDQLGRGRVLSIDIDFDESWPKHPRIEYLTASSVAETTIQKVHRAAADADRTMVILDSDHARDHVLAEMRAYADLVSIGSYLIVEDGNVNGNPVFVDHGPGPQEAIGAFLAERRNFVVDKDQEKFLLTMNPNGYLKRAS